ncbi:hypothetical protein GGI07_003415 [Coemansia sp. Benny D115]|nr:hypothetical protein GGI07_003415 [Coemansia sp. Benny D115]
MASTRTRPHRHLSTTSAASARLLLRAEPIAQVTAFVAGSSPAARAPAAGKLAKQPSFPSLHCSPLLQSRSSAGSNASSKSKEPDALGLLRALLAAAAAVAAKAPEAPQQQQTTTLPPAKDAYHPPQRRMAQAALEEQRHKLAGILIEQQPHLRQLAENILAAHALLSNRVALGLTDAASARAYADARSHRRSIGNLTVVPMDIVSDSPWPTSDADALASSLDSDASQETLGRDDDSVSDDEDDDVLLIRPTAASKTGAASSAASASSSSSSSGLKASLVELWAVNSSIWSPANRSEQAPSLCSEAATTMEDSHLDSLDAQLLPDASGICWALTDQDAQDAAGSWGRFFASLGGVRVPTRFRTPQGSLAMLATEQLMMLNDKLVCPLRNRLQEPNPRRTAFEEHIRLTGALPPAPAKRTPSPLGQACYAC